MFPLAGPHCRSYGNSIQALDDLIGTIWGMSRRISIMKGFRALRKRPWPYDCLVFKSWFHPSRFCEDIRRHKVLYEPWLQSLVAHSRDPVPQILPFKGLDNWPTRDFPPKRPQLAVQRASKPPRRSGWPKW